MDGVSKIETTENRNRLNLATLHRASAVGIASMLTNMTCLLSQHVENKILLPLISFLQRIGGLCVWWKPHGTVCVS